MWVLVGLGNPGKEYQDNRHNIGFMVIDEIAREYGLPAFSKKFEGELTEGRIDGEKVVLVKPMTFMNLSGQCVQKVARFYKVTPNRIVAFHDELDLTAGKMRVKKGGGAAGHNGLKSMDQHLNSQDYWRVRLGIGHPGDKERVTGHVLGDFSKEEGKWLPDWIGALGKHVPLLMSGKHEDYMTKVAADFPAPKQ
ncbi:MAG TPA: aminoacyl-tRNA hydrolase [Micavibrio sp.]|nr:aminoacyl-tRNA hydrolase [Micavibrio sp.]